MVADFRQCLAYAYEPARLFARYDHQSRVTYPNRRPRVYAPGQFTAKDIFRGLSMLALIIWKMGVLADYRRVFWAFAWPRLKAGKIEEVISVCIVSRHLIAYARKACAGELNASHYSPKVRGDDGEACWRRPDRAAARLFALSRKIPRACLASLRSRPLRRR